MPITAVFKNSTDYVFDCKTEGLELECTPGDYGLVAFYGDELKFSYRTADGTKKTLRVTWNLLEGDKEVEVRYQRGSGNITPVGHGLDGAQDPWPADTLLFRLAFFVDDDGIVIVGIDDTMPGIFPRKPTTKARRRARNYRGRYNRIGDKVLDNPNTVLVEDTKPNDGKPVLPGKDKDDHDDDDDDDDKRNGGGKQPK